MRDGSAICIGKGNKQWLNTAPHGAGRIMSRAQAKSKYQCANLKIQWPAFIHHQSAREHWMNLPWLINLQWRYSNLSGLQSMLSP